MMKKKNPYMYDPRFVIVECSFLSRNQITSLVSRGGGEAEREINARERKETKRGGDYIDSNRNLGPSASSLPPCK